MKITTRISWTNPGEVATEKCSVSISISELKDEVEAREVLGKLKPALAKLNGQSTLDGDES